MSEPVNSFDPERYLHRRVGAWNMSLGRPDPPPRLMLCVNTGDWWDPAPPDNDTCPHPGCERELRPEGTDD